MISKDDTIAALATPSGHAGVGVIRVSGNKVKDVIQSVLKKELKPRVANYLEFHHQDEVIDQGIAIYFENPNSFTGEDVLELQGHGGPVVLDRLLKAVLKTEGIRLANPGEFTERAFLNDKIDLVQAEAIADLIQATSEQAVKSAINSMQGEFSKKIKSLVDALIHLRMYVEAAIDFPEEEIDFLADEKISKMTETLVNDLNEIQSAAHQGSLLQEGLKVVLAGKPNAGKSSLLNALSGRDSAIVTHIPGTTRDVLKESIHIDGMPLHIIDTAGLRDSDDPVEKIGIQRAYQEIESADLILMLVDVTETDESEPEKIWLELFHKLPKDKTIQVVKNKVDLSPNSQNKVTSVIKSDVAKDDTAVVESEVKKDDATVNSNENEKNSDPVVSSEIAKDDTPIISTDVAKDNTTVISSELENDDTSVISTDVAKRRNGEISISAKTGLGLDTLKTYLKEFAGFQNIGEGTFIARRRHLEAIESAQARVQKGLEQLRLYKAGELLAEECRLAQDALSSITGEFTSDDLLGKIFGEFCIGK